ncbi:MAG: cellulase family glycosylhydrolase [Spirochaetales bacterium]|nr:cellulase family glycosylhydrolase [Spirochaetales bacterium]
MSKNIIGILLLAVVPFVSVTAQSADDDWLHTSGNKIYDKNNNMVWLTGVNWFGFNCSERVVHGLYARRLEELVDEIAELNFNIVRLPFSTELLNEWRTGNIGMPSSINGAPGVNDHILDLNTLELFDYLLARFREAGIKVIIDIHSPHADNSGHVYPLWYKDNFTYAVFQSTWEWFTERYKNDDTILGFDLENEPHGALDAADGFAKWDGSSDANNWKKAAEDTAKKILAINPNILIFVEGVEAYRDATYPHIKTKIIPNYNPADDPNTDQALHWGWWGGVLIGVKDYPINLGSNQDQLVYSPHEYGPSVYSQQPWFIEGEGITRNQMEIVWDHWWNFIYKQNTAPLFIGEWGGFMSGDNLVWKTLLRDFIRDNKIHHTYWCLNPNSGDTGGIFDSSWENYNNDGRIELIQPALWKDSSGRAIGLDHEVVLGSSGTNVTAYYGGTQQTTPPTVTSPPTASIGDVNSSGSIDIVDALLVAQYYVGLSPSNFDQSRADANCNGSIDIVDALVIAQYYVGLIERFC